MRRERGRIYEDRRLCVRAPADSVRNNTVCRFLKDQDIIRCLAAIDPELKSDKQAVPGRGSPEGIMRRPAVVKNLKGSIAELVEIKKDFFHADTPSSLTAAIEIGKSPCASAGEDL
jgi:hypothetical protein